MLTAGSAATPRRRPAFPPLPRLANPLDTGHQDNGHHTGKIPSILVQRIAVFHAGGVEQDLIVDVKVHRADEFLSRQRL
jgi:hypothetical protein